jgi:hypothetical protein
MSAIVVEIGKQMNGATFQLSPQTRVALAAQMGTQLPTSSVFVAYDPRGSSEQMRGPFWSHIVALLTGMSDDQIRGLGGFSVVSPTDDEVLFESSPN